MRLENYPRFTIIIPEKNRAEYLRFTLQTCMIQDYPNFEIIVSDDNSDDDSVNVVRELSQIDSRIKLYAHDHHLGMRDNFEFALNQVKPGYVMALGGDDGLSSGAIWKMYAIFKETNAELLTWPCATFRYANEKAKESLVYFRRGKNQGVKLIDSKSFLNKISKSFYYLIDDCPMFYIKGVASTNLVERVKSRTNDGSFYYCPTPDGFSGVVLAGEVKQYAFTYEPLSIGGTTTKSQGQNYMRTDKKSREESEQFFNDNVRRTMHKDLASQPYSPLISLMTADYLLTANDLPGWPGSPISISFESLLKAAFKEIEKTPFANEVLVRELKILRNIAIHHNLTTLFDYLYNNTKRKVVKAQNIKGFVITNSIRVDGSSLGINNILDAAYVVPCVYNFYNKYCDWSLPIKIMLNGIKVLLRERKYSEEDLPNINA